MVRAWWESTGGRICEEYPLTPTIPGRQARRRVDALIAPYKPSVWVDWREFGPIDGEDIVVVQAKASRLAMPLLGQAMFSPRLAPRYLGPASVRSVLLCTASDEDLAPFAIEHGVDVVVQPEFGHARPWRLGADRTALAAWAEQEGGEAMFDFQLTPARPGASGQTAHLVLLPDTGPPECAQSAGGRSLTPTAG